MITIIHGDDIVSSRKHFIDQKEQSSLTIDAENSDVTQLEQIVSGSSLFDASYKIFIENLFSRKSTKNFNEIISALNKKTNTDIYILADKILTAKELSTFPKSTVQTFKIPQNIWAFVDGIKPKSTYNISLFRSVLSTTGEEFILAMIIRQFRLMIGLSDNSNNRIDEVKRLAPWQESKLRGQASLFGLENLRKIYKKLYKIDKSQKTGNTNLTLAQNIDIFLLEI